MPRPPSPLTTALDLLRDRLTTVSKAAVPAPPASQLLQRHGLEATIEQRWCGEMLTFALSRQVAPADGPDAADLGFADLLDRAAVKSVLVVDAARTGRAAAVWTGKLMELFAGLGRSGPHVTLALPGTRWAGRGKLLDRHLGETMRRTRVAAELLCGPASVAAAAPAGADERELVTSGFDLILVLGLAGSAGLDAPWPAHPARPWLELAQGAVLTCIDAGSVMDDLSRYANVAPPRPLRLLVERLDEDEPERLGEVVLDDLEQARKTLPPLVEEARPHPWRIVIRPQKESRGTELGCYDERSLRRLLGPLAPRRTLVAGRVLLASS